MIKRIVSTSFWTDSKVVDDFSPEDRYFMLYLLTNPHTTQLGIYELNLRTAAFELGYSVEAVAVLMERFETKYKIIKRSKKTNEIAILNYLSYAVVKGGKPVTDLLERDKKSVKDKDLIDYVAKHLKSREDLLPTVTEFLSKIEPYINDNDNDNDNDNESTLDDTSTVRKTNRENNKNKFIPPTFEDVEAYAKERKRSDLAKKFFDYYTEGNWKDKDGKPVKNWKQKFITWEGRNNIKEEKESCASYDLELFENMLYSQY